MSVSNPSSDFTKNLTHIAVYRTAHTHVTVAGILEDTPEVPLPEKVSYHLP